MTNSGTSDTLNQQSCAGCNGSTTSAEQLRNNGSQSHPGLFAPILQVTETIITTTTFYSPTDKSTSTTLGGDNNRVPGAVNKSDRQRNAHDPPTIPTWPTQALHIDKELPRLPSEATEVGNTNASPPISVTFPSASDHDGSPSTAFLAHAALRLSSPALGFSLERPLRQSSSQHGPGAAGSAFPAEHTEPKSPLPISGCRAISHSLCRLTEPSSMESNVGVVAPEANATSTAPRGNTSPLESRFRAGSKIMLRSRSMYGRIIAVHEDNPPDPELGPIPRSSIISHSHLLRESGASDVENNATVKRFWKVPFRSGTIKSSIRRPRTSDGAPAPKPREQFYTMTPAPKSTSQLTDIDIESPVAVTPTSALTRHVFSTGTERDLTSLRPTPIRRVTSVPKLAPGDVPAARRRSVSLFQRRRSRESFLESAPSQPHSTPSFQAPRVIPGQKQSPLLRKLSRTFLSSSKPTSPNIQEPSSPQPGALIQPEQSHPLLIGQFDDETPESYVQRMSHSVNPVEIAGILAVTNDVFFSRALRAYMRHFDFRNRPLDIALRLLLLETKLPRETQQIDRILGAFATRYEECNPDLYSAPDASYILAYSLVLLHSDAFNKANKIKMQKDAYVKNTRLPGIHPVILEYFYDNVTAQPFRLASDHPEDIGQRVGLEGHHALPGDRTVPSLSAGLRRNDVYDLIEQDMLHTLNINVQDFMPSKSPFVARFSISFSQILQFFEEGIEVRRRAPSKRKDSAPGSLGAITDITSYRDSFRVIKAGVLRRRVDMLLGNQKNRNRKWKSMTAVLTPSQLLFFRGPTVTMHIESLLASGAGIDVAAEPEDVVSLQNAFSVKEEGLSPDMFRFVSPSRHQYILQTDDPGDADLWITLINYASVFRTSGLHMRTKKALSSYVSSLPAGSKALSRNVHNQDMRHSGTPESPSHQHPCSAVITAKLEDIRVQTERSRVALASEMRQIRNLAILTPLRKSTRDRIIRKLECEREVLHADLVSFEEEISSAVLQPEQSRTEIQREPSPAVRGSRNPATDSQPESLSPGVENCS